MKTKVSILLLLTLIFTTGCEDNFSKPTPDWVDKILSRVTNNSSLVGTWSYSSIVSYDNTDCSGEGELSDYSGTVTYGEMDAVRTENLLLTFSDFQQKGYSENTFQEMCFQKNGSLNAGGNCELTWVTHFEYFLTENGYCETYSKDNSKGESITFCGSLTQLDGSSEITFLWDSDKTEKSGCKIVGFTIQ